jgi:hypothetical protein
MSDVDVLNEGLAGEFFGVAAYEAAIGSGLLDDGTLEVARAFQADHQAHADKIVELIVERGGTPVQPLAAEVYAEEYPPLTDAGDVIAYAIELESGAASASVASVALYEDRALAVVAAQIAGVEAQHWSALLAATGQAPVPGPLIPVPAEVG